MKRLFIFIAASLLALTAAAQGVMQLPTDTTIVVGKLDNGMTYYLKSNPLPAQRAEFYLATNVGAFQEADDQDGLAHFLEHMCFNGTKNFPGKALLDYLQSIGAEFGRNINASTGFEETRYMLNNIPIVRDAIIDSCLLVMHDYSHFVTCDPAEIDAERGVILEERRTRRNAGWRMFEKTLPYYFAGQPYQKRTLIGGEEQLKTFKYESLTNFYHKWYRPDMQALVVVGDIDVKAVEEKIKRIFSDIPAPEVPTEKPVYPFEKNEKPNIAILTDPEAGSSSLEILWKTDPIPAQLKNTNLGFTVDLIRTVIEQVMAERFNDIASRPDSPFLSARFGFSPLCNECDVVMGNISFKDGQIIPAYTALLTEIEKMKRYGFSEGEIQRAKDNIISYYEKVAEAASTRKNPDFIDPILRNFYDNEPLMDPQTTLEILKAMSGQLNSTIVKQMFEQTSPDFMAGKYVTMVFNGPEKEGLANPDPAVLESILESIKDAEIEANAEENTNEPLLDESKLKGSKVKSESKGIYGTTVWTLKNGLKVIVKPTEFKKDQIIMDLYMPGGKTLISNEDLYSFEDNVWGIFIENAGLSKFPGTTLSKMLAGKIANANPYISGNMHGISGSCSPRYLETALQMMYLTFTDMRFDPQEYETGIQQINAILPNLEGQPDFKFQMALDKTLHGDNPRAVLFSKENLAKANLETIERCYKELFSGVNGATLQITGNVDLETLKPLIEKYMGSLPKGKKAPAVKGEVPTIVKGQHENNFAVAMQTPKTTVLQVYTADMPYSLEARASMDAAKFILDMIYVQTLRESEGGTYGASTSASLRREPKESALVQVYFDTNPDAADKLRALAVDGLKKLAAEGPTQAQVDMAKENMKKNLPESRINNGYWHSNIKSYYRYGEDKDAAIEAAIDSVSIDSIKKVLSDVLAQNNFIEIVMHP